MTTGSFKGWTKIGSVLQEYSRDPVRGTYLLTYCRFLITVQNKYSSAKVSPRSVPCLATVALVCLSFVLLLSLLGRDLSYSRITSRLLCTSSSPVLSTVLYGRYHCSIDISGDLFFLCLSLPWYAVLTVKKVFSALYSVLREEM